jgi:hypothetical protein
VVVGVVVELVVVGLVVVFVGVGLVLFELLELVVVGCCELPLLPLGCVESLGCVEVGVVEPDELPFEPDCPLLGWVDVPLGCDDVPLG